MSAPEGRRAPERFRRYVERTNAQRQDILFLFLRGSSASTTADFAEHGCLRQYVFCLWRRAWRRNTSDAAFPESVSFAKWAGQGGWICPVQQHFFESSDA